MNVALSSAKSPMPAVETHAAHSFIVPTFPKTNTLAARALMRLLMGQKFTHLEFQRETHSYRLSEFIRLLRHHHGWPIVTKAEAAMTSDPTGRTAEYARYMIDPDVLHELRKMVGGERLDAFIDAVLDYETRPAAANKVRGGQYELETR